MAMISGHASAMQFCRDVADFVGDKSKVVLTSRSNYFQSRISDESVLGSGESVLAAKLSNRPVFDVVYLQAWSPSQIEQYIRNAEPRNSEKLHAQLKSIYKLPELASRPVLLDLIVRSLPLVGPEGLSPSTLYRAYVDASLDRAVRKNTVRDPIQSRKVLQDVAWYMVSTGKSSVRISELLSDIESLSGQ